MASWILVPCLVKLRSDFNAIAPNRDRSSDGSVGDLAHQNSQSDHNPDETGNVPIRDPDKVNEVHAIDVDVDLRVPGLSMENVVQFLLTRCRSGAEKRLRYIIYNRRIWQASNGWRQKPYTGPNAHDHHGHFSASYESHLEASTASWHLEDIPVAFTEDDKKWLSAEITKQVKAQVADLAASIAAVPTADQNGAAALRAFRSSPTTGMSDTGRNLISAEITEAVVAGVAVERFAANKGK
ncbi:hypothetical protein OWR29_25600 [Actinoplanes sp. Pm04-4]|uniref:Uncharacterized protein n=1 Tax=Paractinoplanes pyxinae TaxID=2997416 RepID=A0ABT4B713_9ACTN|nr:hypothetical protein [Actinoplanes pyxinae]MCY1141388.1 hypothetical protein [Actinoplanes pyxinae]